MNRIKTIVFGMLAILLTVPSLGASEVPVTSENTEVTSEVKQDTNDDQQIISEITEETSTVEQEVSESKQVQALQSKVKYAQKNATLEEVKNAEPTDIVVFNDAKLEAAVASAIGDGATVGSITVEEMATIDKSIDCFNCNISDLTGLEYAINVTVLNLNENNISDISALANLTKLIDLMIPYNNITDLTPISKLQDLRYLWASYNKINDVGTLENLINLKRLSLDHNNISDISSLRKLTKLEDFFVNTNQINDFSVISNFINLEVLSISENRSNDLNAISNLTNLEALQADGNNITDIKPLKKLKNLKYLYISDNKISDISTLEKLSGLRNLYISNNEISDIRQLRTMSRLTGLYLDGNKISDISSVSYMSELKVLNISNNYITNIPTMPSTLEIIWANNNNISNLTSLAQFKSIPLLMIAEMNEQIIELPDIVVNTNSEITHEIIGIDGEVMTITLGVPALGENNFTAPIAFEEPFMASAHSNINLMFSATVKQKVIYHVINAKESVTVKEGTVLTDDEILELFNVENTTGRQVTVDQSAVDYNLAGTYDIILTDGMDQITTSLVIEDILPTMTIGNETVNIEVDSNVHNLVEAFDVKATEINEGDLTSNIKVNDSAVDYKNIGKYTVQFTATDNEGNNVEKNAKIAVITNEEKSEIVSDITNEEESEIVSDVINEEESEIVSDITNEKNILDKDDNILEDDKVTDEINLVDVTDSKTKQEKKITTDTESKSLQATGNQVNGLLLTLTSFIGLLVCLKYVINRKSEI